MSRYMIAIVAILVLVLLGSTAGLVMAGRTTPDVPGQAAVFAPGPAPQPADDDDDDDDDEHSGPHIKFEGSVESVSIDASCTGDIYVANAGNGEELVTVHVTCDTKIEHGSLADIKVGDWVKVKGWLLGTPDTVLAKEIEIKEHHDDEDECRKEEFYGELTDWNGYPDTDPGTDPGDWWIIGSHKVLIDENTEIRGAPAAGGDLVKVEACRQPGEGGETVWVARELKVHHRPDDEHDFPVEFSAPIVFLPDTEGRIGAWKVGFWWIEVTSDTAIVGVPEVGRKVEVRGTQAPEGWVVDDHIVQVIAGRIKVKGHYAPGPDVEVIKIEGAITGFADTDGSSVAPTTVPAVWKIEGTPVMRIDTTLVEDHHVSPAVGVWAEARAVVQRDGTGAVVSYDALRIKMEYEEEPPGEVHFEGNYEEGVVGGDWTVSGWVFLVPADVAGVTPGVGDRVKIKATATYDDKGTPDRGDDTYIPYVAFKVKVRDGDHD